MREMYVYEVWTRDMNMMHMDLMHGYKFEE